MAMSLALGTLGVENNSSKERNFRLAHKFYFNKTKAIFISWNINLEYRYYSNFDISSLAFDTFKNLYFNKLDMFCCEMYVNDCLLQTHVGR